MMLLKEVSAFMFVTIACISAEYVESSPDCQPVTDVSFEGCLALSDGVNDIQNVPQPIALTTPKDKFVCAGQAPQFFFFSCTLYGNEAVWFFNEQHVVSYQNNDTDVRTPSRRQYPASPDDPSYALVTTLELVEHETLYGTSQCISTLIVQPFYLNESQPNMPFNVTCLTYCLNQSLNAAVCQREHYRVAEIPMQPVNLQYTTNQTVVSLKWEPPLNKNNYELEYYTVTLEGKEPHMSLYTSYDTVVDEAGTYYVIVTATNSCGNESEPANMTIQVDKSSDLEVIISNQRNTIDNLKKGLGIPLGLFSFVLVGAIITIVILAVVIVHFRH